MVCPCGWCSGLSLWVVFYKGGVVCPCGWSFIKVGWSVPVGGLLIKDPTLPFGSPGILPLSTVELWNVNVCGR